MPRKMSAARQTRRTRPIRNIESEVLGHFSGYVAPKMPINSKDVARQASDRLKKVNTRTAVRAHTEQAINRWSLPQAPQHSGFFWNRPESQGSEFYISAHCGGLAVAAFCVLEDLRTTRPNERIGGVFSPQRQASAQLLRDLLVDASGGEETARLLEQPMPEDLNIISETYARDYDYGYDRPVYTPIAPERRLLGYDREHLEEFVATLHPTFYLKMGHQIIQNTRAV